MKCFGQRITNLIIDASAIGDKGTGLYMYILQFTVKQTVQSFKPSGKISWLQDNSWAPQEVKSLIKFLRTANKSSCNKRGSMFYMHHLEKYLNSGSI